MKVAIQGELGSFHHAAAQNHFGATASIVTCKTFVEVFGLLADHQVDKAVVATENSIAGAVPGISELLQRYKFPVLANINLPIHHCLIALPGATLRGITHVYSQDMALAQCSDFLARTLPQARRVVYYDTAGSVRFVKREANPHYAAIAGRLAAELESLPVLQANIEDRADNTTHFVVLAPNAV
jgi:prephenate dehydratase